MKKNNEWIKSVERALKSKGVSRPAARKTAAATVKKSLEKSELSKKREAHATDWKETSRVYRASCSSGARAAQVLHDAAAINKQSTMVGKIVVVKRKTTER